MKRILSNIFLVLVLIFVPAWSVGQDTIVVIDGEGYMFDPSPVNVEGRKLVPMRPLFEAFGANVHWDSGTNTVICYIDDSKIHISIEGYTAVIDGEEKLVDVPARLINGSTFVPLRFIGEALGYAVNWDNATKTIQISIPGNGNDDSDILYSVNGIASWYGGKFHGRRTSSGEVFNQHEFTAAHRTLPFGTLVNVTFMDTGKSIQVRINDRGPYVQDRIIDLSRAAAEAIGLRPHGLGEVRIEVLSN
ncbi:septal ring lytic transglycosylase RlpA family protein [Desulfitibacter alkalitolerans]|uniref:septal ring lytic transglycosylase RlpA family protein n=1 Tax=Desulfitibacter alkalitolerans TaxID=264641 RepID=UPI000688CA59|nr:septal ring lytic transglycosylase RlpA family protein [Desulfitibacter alkalitolerans]